ncbi:MAG: AbrB/MazE/SpoVT family DNA-binding domain-containing protein [Spirochaetales bacterium]
MKTVVSEKGQITLPKALRVSLGIKAGAELEVTEVDGRLMLEKRSASDPAARWRGRGKLPEGFASGADYLASTRE